MIEIGWADAHRKPLIVVMEKENIHYHPIVTSIAGFIVPTLEQAIAVAISVLG